MLFAIGLTSAICAVKPSRGAQPAEFPVFDIDAVCRDVAAYAFAATLGQVDQGQEQAACARHEHVMRELARTAWAQATPRSRGDCIDLAGQKYSVLARCLDPAISGQAAP